MALLITEGELHEFTEALYERVPRELLSQLVGLSSDQFVVVVLDLLILLEKENVAIGRTATS
jgi:restriction endonuclease Mrr